MGFEKAAVNISQLKKDKKKKEKVPGDFSPCFSASVFCRALKEGENLPDGCSSLCAYAPLMTSPCNISCGKMTVSEKKKER